MLFVIFFRPLSVKISNQVSKIKILILRASPVKFHVILSVDVRLILVNFTNMTPSTPRFSQSSCVQVKQMNVDFLYENVAFVVLS